MHFVTFNIKLGSRGQEVAAGVARELGYRLCDREEIESAAREMGFLASVVEVDEKTPSMFQRIFSHKPAIELDRLNSAIYELAKGGDCVFVDRAAQVLLKSFSCALHVLITAPEERRVQNLVAGGYDPEGALKAVHQSDHEKGGFLKFAFGLDWSDPELYDLVLNMDKVSVGLAVETVVGMARSAEIKACSADAMRSLSALALGHRAEAAVIEAGLSYGPGTAVSVTVPAPGRVRLSGLVGDEASKKRAEEVVKRVPGVETVENWIRTAPADRHA